MPTGSIPASFRADAELTGPIPESSIPVRESLKSFMIGLATAMENVMNRRMERMIDQSKTNTLGYDALWKERPAKSARPES